jgi:copper homeostasis protein
LIALEICINADELQLLDHNITAALTGGASRIELCADMRQQGMTPSVQAIQIARRCFASKAGLLVMVRFSPDDQIQHQAGLSAMQRAIAQAADAGADGVVLGLLTAQRSLDSARLTLLVEQAKKLGLQVTFHRAFDAIADQNLALEQLINTGVDRVLSAGTLWGSNQGVLQGLNRLQQLKVQAAGRIELVAGGGINQDNLNQVCQSLKPAGNHWSVHSYSAVLTQGKVDPNKVASLVRLCQ